mmetsp:Transcript_36548/g.91489  ORF Transcript_36548/g.91489 Transcript_36548/m.91489 type:complete len:149 (+) Transcript_36548:646-1092(+)
MSVRCSTWTGREKNIHLSQPVARHTIVDAVRITLVHDSAASRQVRYNTADTGGAGERLRKSPSSLTHSHASGQHGMARRRASVDRMESQHNTQHARSGNTQHLHTRSDTLQAATSFVSGALRSVRCGAKNIESVHFSMRVCENGHKAP